MLTVLLVVLAQPLISDTGFKSTAQMAQSGMADFICGNSDNLEDGGIGPYSRYCLFVLRQSSWYDGFHGDLTISTESARYAGWLFFLNNPAYGSGVPILKLRYDGLLSSRTGFEIDSPSTGGGFSNKNSYVLLMGNSPDPNTPDVITASSNWSYDPSAWAYGHFKAGHWPFRVRNDGAVAHNDLVLKYEDNGDALKITKELPDGGTRTAVIPWQ